LQKGAAREVGRINIESGCEAAPTRGRRGGGKGREDRLARVENVANEAITLANEGERGGEGEGEREGEGGRERERERD